MTVAEAISMTLAEIKHRHNLRKITDAPIVRILGPDTAAKDMDALLEIVDYQKQILRDVAAYLRTNARPNDEVFDELINRVGGASE
jgi:hypothetical protein